MKIKMIVDEDFSNYKKPAMFIGTSSCGGKCCTEANIPLSICQNDGWRNNAPVHYGNEKIFKRYIDNKITSAFVIGGLEPFEQYGELLDLVVYIRDVKQCEDDIVIFTGYYPSEIHEMLHSLRKFKNIIVKFGRYVPNDTPVFDELLGVTLASKNQKAIMLQPVQIKQNQNKEFVATMREKLKENDGYCPCMLEKNPNTKCMCEEFRSQPLGECHCGLYVKSLPEKELQLEGQLGLDEFE